MKMYRYLTYFNGRVMLISASTKQDTTNPEILELSENAFIFMRDICHTKEFKPDLTFLVG